MTLRKKFDANKFCGAVKFQEDSLEIKKNFTMNKKFASKKLLQIDNCISESICSINKIGTVDLRQDIYLRILFRILNNFQGARILYDKNKNELTPSVCLLLRACIMDVITFLYLETFSSDPNSFKAEIYVSDLDFIKACQDIFEIEKEWVVQVSEKEAFKDFPHIFIDDNFLRSKKPQDIRKELNANQKLYSGNIYTKKIGDTDKFTQIKKKGELKIKISSYQAKYKLFSQFQHFSSKGTELFPFIGNFETFIVEAFIDCARSMGTILTIWPEVSLSCKKMKVLISKLDKSLSKEKPQTLLS